MIFYSNESLFYHSFYQISLNKAGGKKDAIKNRLGLIRLNISSRAINFPGSVDSYRESF